MKAVHPASLAEQHLLVEQALRRAADSLGRMLAGAAVVDAAGFTPCFADACRALDGLRRQGLEVALPLFGGVTGSFVFVLTRPAAQQIVRTLAATELPRLDIGPLARSVLAEIGNVVASSFLSGLEQAGIPAARPGLPVLQDQPFPLVSNTEPASVTLYGLTVNLFGDRIVPAEEAAGLFVLVEGKIPPVLSSRG
jgi:hypothetical protein